MSVVTVGNFDGVHLGHQAILQNVLNIAKKKRLPSIAVTFNPHPSVILGYPPPKLLTSPQERSKRIRGLGIDDCIILPFTEKLSHLTAQEFLERELIKNLSMKVLVIGPDNHVGKNREGDPNKLEELSHSLGYEFYLAKGIVVDGESVSSSRVRKALEVGNVSKAAQLLGRVHENSGRVVTGDGRGLKLGFPTANLSISSEFQLPGAGVYAIQVRWRDRLYSGVANLGTRPTFHTSTQVVTEAHLFDFQENLVGETVQILWIDRIRDEMRFPSASDLVQQIRQDADMARKILRNRN